MSATIPGTQSGREDQRRHSRHFPDGAFDRITAIAADLFAVPIAITSIFWFKSHDGRDVEQIDRESDFRAPAIAFHGSSCFNAEKSHKAGQPLTSHPANSAERANSRGIGGLEGRQDEILPDAVTDENALQHGASSSENFGMQ
jgi:hypothetical protein